MPKSGYNRTVICAICGKEFCPSTYHVYKKRNRDTDKMDYCCTYSCFRKLEKQDENKKKYLTRASFNKGDW